MKKGVQANLFNDMKDFFKNIIFSRLFVLIILFIIMFTVLIQKLFVLQIVNGESYVDNFELKGIVIDNYYFGVASVSKSGHESVVVFPNDIIRTTFKRK